jgi:hypothetical protein
MAEVEGAEDPLLAVRNAQQCFNFNPTATLQQSRCSIDSQARGLAGAVRTTILGPIEVADVSSTE